MEKQEFLDLLEKHFRGETDQAEEEMLKNYLQSFQDENIAGEISEPELRHSEARVLQRLEHLLKEEKKTGPAPVRKLFPAILKWSAAAILLLSFGFYWISRQDKNNIPAPAQAFVQTKTELPGTNRATLTLSSGQKVELNADSIQQISDTGINISNQEGTIYYPDADVAVYNTMTTPKGAQYKLILADSTLVWLNAQSSITFPTAFQSGERKVSITGEAYFEVKKNTAKPFLVDVHGMQVKVLGTHFNIMAYPEEKNIAATLIEGAVAVSTMDKEVLLKPGEQAKLQTMSQKLQVYKNVDTEEVTSWLRGEMNFDNSNIESVMTQIARWYDIDVKFDLQPEDITITGKIFRRYNLKQVLEILEATHKVSFGIDGNKITVKPYKS